MSDPVTWGSLQPKPNTACFPQDAPHLLCFAWDVFPAIKRGSIKRNEPMLVCSSSNRHVQLPKQQLRNNDWCFYFSVPGRPAQHDSSLPFDILPLLFRWKYFSFLPDGFLFLFSIFAVPPRASMTSRASGEWVQGVLIRKSEPVFHRYWKGWAWGFTDAQRI